MKNLKIKTRISFYLLIAIMMLGCNPNPAQEPDIQLSQEEANIRQVHHDYVEGWKSMNEEKVMGLLEEQSIIQPNRLTPIEGKENIRAFWFPKDSSTTVIHKFDTEVISLKLMDSLAIGTHSSLLDWTYQKDTINFGMIQKGFNTTIYRKQKDQSWKIWRSMWTDIEAKSK